MKDKWRNLNENVLVKLDTFLYCFALMKFIVIPSNHPRYVSNLLSIDMSTLDGIAIERGGES